MQGLDVETNDWASSDGKRVHQRFDGDGLAITGGTIKQQSTLYDEY